MKFINLTGQKFNRLTVLERVENNKRGQARWKCQCDCKKFKEVDSTSLINGHTKSCGCLRLESLSERTLKDLTNLIFGKLTVVRENGRNKNNLVIWECQCDCGNISNVLSSRLQNGMTKSCGCKSRGSQTHGTIYGIYDKDNILKYIGQTVKYKLEDRLKNHIKQPRSKMKNWLSSINYRPIIKPLVQNVPINCLNQTEKAIIENLGKKHNLLNTVYNN